MKTLASHPAVGRQMGPVVETIAAVGEPVFIHEVGEESSPGAVIARWRHSGGDIDIGPSDVVRIVVNLQGGQQVRQLIGQTLSRANIKVGSISVLPSHLRTQVAIRGEADILQIFLREAFLHSAVEEKCASWALFNAHDSTLQAAAMQLLVAATRGDPDDSLLLDSALHHIATRLNRGDRQPCEPARGGLAPAAYRRVDDLISASLEHMTARSPTLAQLASAACLSVNHFIRAFQRHTGMTPHRHVVLRRLERGIALLKQPGKSVGEVADAVGFATPAHFVATFRRTMGVTPGAFRTALLG